MPYLWAAMIRSAANPTTMATSSRRPRGAAISAKTRLADSSKNKEYAGPTKGNAISGSVERQGGAGKKATPV